MFQAAAPFGGVGEIAVVAERDFALIAINHDGLRVEERFVAGGGIARVADGAAAGKFLQNIGREDFFDFAHGAVGVKFGAVARDDAGRFLAAVLERIEAEIDEFSGFGVAENSNDAAMVVEVVVEYAVRTHRFRLSSRILLEQSEETAKSALPAYPR